MNMRGIDGRKIVHNPPFSLSANLTFATLSEGALCKAAQGATSTIEAFEYQILSPYEVESIESSPIG